MRDLYHNFLSVSTLAPTARNTNANGATVDLLGYDSCLMVVDIGGGGVAFTDTNYIEVQLEHSDDGSTWADVVTGDVQRASTDAVANGVVIRPPNQLINVVVGVETVGYIGNKRYVRGSVNFQGTHSTATSISIVALLGNASYRPVV